MVLTASAMVVLIVASSTLCAPTAEESLASTKESLASTKESLASTKESLASTKESASTNESLASTEQSLASTGESLASTGQSLASTEQSVVDLSKIRTSGRPRDCADLYISGQNHSGVFNIFPYEGSKPPIATYCDMESDGGGWTVFQRRGQFGNPVYDFYRGWEAYKNGFGDPAKEFWLGNQLIHIMTSKKATSLRIVLTNRTGETFTADYASFKIAGENEQYKLIVSGYKGARGYDAFSLANGAGFSTFDKDNDKMVNSSCAVAFSGAWWYKNCHAANLNGLNLNGAHASYADGIEWSIRGGRGNLYHYSFPQVEMKMRDASFATLAARTAYA
ncbi:techylectin-5A-like isoform X1 [Ornithodoros turicata]|uniref:techylectin-5A-like isoform X1 n=1 Tax=Ornithodoros turicata TaxID=34597 RepID=UPI0031397274